MKGKTTIVCLVASVLCSSWVLAQLPKGEAAQQGLQARPDGRLEVARDADSAEDDRKGEHGPAPVDDLDCLCYLRRNCRTEVTFTDWCWDGYSRWPCGCPRPQAPPCTDRYPGCVRDPVPGIPCAEWETPYHNGCIPAAGPKVDEPSPGCGTTPCGQPLVVPTRPAPDSTMLQPDSCGNDCLVHPMRPGGPRKGGAFASLTDH